jgi:hypothetical protein
MLGTASCPAADFWPFQAGAPNYRDVPVPEKMVRWLTLQRTLVLTLFPAPERPPS